MNRIERDFNLLLTDSMGMDITNSSNNSKLITNLNGSPKHSIDYLKKRNSKENKSDKKRMKNKD